MQTPMPGRPCRRNKFATRFPTQPAPLKGAKTVMSSWLEQATNHPWCLLSPRRPPPPSEVSKPPVLSTAAGERGGRAHTRRTQLYVLWSHGQWLTGRPSPLGVVSDAQCGLHSTISWGALSHAVPQPHRGPLNPSLWGWGASMSIIQNCREDSNVQPRLEPEVSASTLCQALQEAAGWPAMPAGLLPCAHRFPPLGGNPASAGQLTWSISSSPSPASSCLPDSLGPPHAHSQPLAPKNVLHID